MIKLKCDEAGTVLILLIEIYLLFYNESKLFVPIQLLQRLPSAHFESPPNDRNNISRVYYQTFPLTDRVE